MLKYKIICVGRSAEMMKILGFLMTSNDEERDVKQLLFLTKNDKQLQVVWTL